MVGRRALVTAEANVLTGHCRRGNGGLWYHDWQELEAAVRVIDPDTKEALGQQGRRYVATEYSWDRVERDYLELLQRNGTSAT